MGGTALATPTRRIELPELLSLQKSLEGVLVTFFHKFAFPINVLNKHSFGDIDVVVSNPKEVSWKEEIKKTTKEFNSNGIVFSFNYQDVQVDLIHVPEREFDFAKMYYSHGDLGNFIGRIAKTLGFRYGHMGLLHDETGIEVSTDLFPVLSFLGFNSPIPEESISLEEIFKYAMSSCLFDPSMYPFHNRNAEGTHRDKKRPNYDFFLSKLQREGYDLDVPLIKHNKLFHLRRALQLFPEFRERWEENKLNKELKILRDSKFNGTLAKLWTGLSGKELGEFIKLFRSQPGIDRWLETATIEEAECLCLKLKHSSKNLE